MTQWNVPRRNVGSELLSRMQILGWLNGFTQPTVAIWFSSLNLFASEKQMHKLNFGNVHQSPIPEDVY